MIILKEYPSVINTFKMIKSNNMRSDSIKHSLQILSFSNNSQIQDFLRFLAVVVPQFQRYFN